MGENGNGNRSGFISNIITNIIVALLILIGTALIAIDGFWRIEVWENNQSITELKSTAISRKEINDTKFIAYDAKATRDAGGAGHKYFHNIWA